MRFQCLVCRRLYSEDMLPKGHQGVHGRCPYINALVWLGDEARRCKGSLILLPIKEEEAQAIDEVLVETNEKVASVDWAMEAAIQLLQATEIQEDLGTASRVARLMRQRRELDVKRLEEIADAIDYPPHNTPEGKAARTQVDHLLRTFKGALDL